MGIEKMGHLWENWYAQETINLFFTKPLNYESTISWKMHESTISLF